MREHGVGGRQGRLQVADDGGLDGAPAFDAEAQQAVARLLLLAVALPRVGGDGDHAAGGVQAQALQVVQLRQPGHVEGLHVCGPAGIEAEQAEGMLLLVLGHQEAAVRQLLYGGGLVEAGQRPEGHPVHHEGPRRRPG